jgi:hypothetical protein
MEMVEVGGNKGGRCMAHREGTGKKDGRNGRRHKQTLN